ncbi:uncharacterized protein F4822DRAFT_407040 [Hypoxylon trugodes]|uniref:uncharacterized protein n=1 Tax=Hypoxylon trugodes TaxID=326681 RepID=UPI00219B72B5|nr:uncharacterized protein F4822DRAFT_407040 [Hypoxylon trugodes]KAI1387588.1 hypothetical protein F4822DRAFT_407040 [Hypoxylon trugodes]
MAQNDMIIKGTTQVLTGLGILLGAGHISSTTHEKILALLSGDQSSTVEIKMQAIKEGQNAMPRPGKETPVSIQSHDLLGLGGELADLAIADNSPALSTPTAPARSMTSSTAAPKSGPNVKIICPWWLTEGYSCREKKCGMYHEDIPGALIQPLICHFWADGGRCSKTEANCRFAHYQARHHLVAPTPKKKGKKNRVVTANEDNVNEWYNASSAVTPVDTSHDGYWRGRARSPAPEEWQ